MWGGAQIRIQRVTNRCNCIMNEYHDHIKEVGEKLTKFEKQYFEPYDVRLKTQLCTNIRL